MRIDDRPQLRSPVLIAAFQGWNDGGSAASLTAAFLRTTLDATPFAVIEPEEYVDFQQIRPRVSLRDGMTREISWPDTEFFHAPLPGRTRDVVLCIGVEPNLRWKAFTGEIAGLCRDLGVGLALTLGGLLADVPHTRPIQVTGAAADAALAGRLGIRPSRYEGPTGIVGVLHDTLAREGIESASLWAAVPHYIASNAPNPDAAIALVRFLETILEVSFDTHELESGAAEFQRQVSEVLEGDEETAAYVRDLEQRDPDDDAEIPSGDELAEELQRFLRDHRDEP